jgi:hypothetical protein
MVNETASEATTAVKAATTESQERQESCPQRRCKPEIPATDVADTSGRDAGHDTREEPTLADMTCRDLESEGRMIALDGLSD